MPGFGVGGIMVKIGADARGFTSGLSAAEKQLNKFGSSLAVAGQRMSMAFTVPLVAAGAFALKVGADFEKAVAGVRKTVNDAKVSMDVLEKSFRDTAKASVFSASELANFARIGAQMGVGQGNDTAKNTYDLQQFAKAIAEVSVAASELPPESAARGLARLMTLTGEDVGAGIGKLGSVLAFLGDKLPTTEERILNFSVLLGGVAKTAKLSSEELLGISAGFSSVVEGTERAASSVQLLTSKLVGAVIDGGPALKEFAEIMGTTGEAIQRTFQEEGLGPVIADFMEGLAGLSEEGHNTFQVLKDVGLGNIRATQTFLAGAGGIDKFRLAMVSATEDGDRYGKTAKEMAIQNELVSSKLSFLWHEIQDVGIQIFNDFEDVIRGTIFILTGLVQAVGFVAKGIGMLPTPIKAGIAAFIALLAAVGPVLFAVGSLITIGPSLSAAMGMIGASTATSTVAIRAFSPLLGASGAAATTATASFSGLLLVLGKLALAIAGVVLVYKGFTALMNATGMMEGLKNYVSSITDVLFKYKTTTLDATASTAALYHANEILKEKAQGPIKPITDVAEALKIIAERAEEAKNKTIELGMASGNMTASGTATTKGMREQIAVLIKNAEAESKVQKAASALNMELDDLKAMGDEYVQTAISMIEANEKAEENAKKLAAAIEAIKNGASQGIFGNYIQEVTDADRRTKELEKTFMRMRGLINLAVLDQFGLPEVAPVDGMRDRDEAMSDSMKRLKHQIDNMPTPIKDAQKAFDQSISRTADVMQALGDIAETAFGQMIHGAMLADSSMKQFQLGLEQIKGGNYFDGIINGIAGVIGAYQAMKKATEGGGKKGAIGGAMTGAQIGGSIVPGWGHAIGAAVGAIIGALRGQNKVMEEIGRDYGITISKELAKAIEETADKLDLGRFEATLIHLGDLIREAGGVDSSNLQQFSKGINDLMNAIAMGVVPAAEGMEALDDAFMEMVEGLQEMGPKGQLEIAALIERMKELGLVTEEVKEFVRDMAASAIEKLTPFLDLLNTQFGEDGVFAGNMEAASANVGVLVAAFGAAVTAAGGLGGAVALLPESFDALMEKFKELLGEESAVFNELQSYYNFAKENADVLSGIEGLISAMGDLASIGIVNTGNINEFGMAAVTQMQQVLDSTDNQTMALMAMAPQIAELLKMYNEMGVEVPPALKEIADKALEAGANLEPPEGMEDILSSIRDVLYDIAEALGAVTSEANGANNALKNLGNVPGGGNIPGGGDGPIKAANEFAGVVTGPTNFLAGEAGPEFVSVTKVGQEVAGSSDPNTGGGGGPVTNTITVNLPPGSDEELADRIARLIERGVSGVDKRILNSL